MTAKTLIEEQPMAWRIKDYADGWILQETLTASSREMYESDGHLVEPLYSAAYVRQLEAERDELRRAVEWQDISTAPKDGTPIDLWGVNHLHPAKTGRRATNVTWGRVRDWLGNERDDWQHGQGEDFEPTHWMPLPPAPLALNPERAEGGE